MYLIKISRFLRGDDYSFITEWSLHRKAGASVPGREKAKEPSYFFFFFKKQKGTMWPLPIPID
jgi:hypothetical protein